MSSLALRRVRAQDMFNRIGSIRRFFIMAITRYLCAQCGLPREIVSRDLCKACYQQTRRKEAKAQLLRIAAQ